MRTAASTRASGRRNIRPIGTRNRYRRWQVGSPGRLSLRRHAQHDAPPAGPMGPLTGPAVGSASAPTYAYPSSHHAASHAQCNYVAAPRPPHSAQTQIRSQPQPFTFTRTHRSGPSRSHSHSHAHTGPVPAAAIHIHTHTQVRSQPQPTIDRATGTAGQLYRYADPQSVSTTARAAGSLSAPRREQFVGSIPHLDAPHPCCLHPCRFPSPPQRGRCPLGGLVSAPCSAPPMPPCPYSSLLNGPENS